MKRGTRFKKRGGGCKHAGERLAARRCVIIANLLRCYRIRAWSCTSNSAEGGRCFLKRGTRFKKREGRMQARRGAPRGKGRGSRPDERKPPSRRVRRAKTTEPPTSESHRVTEPTSESHRADERRVTFCAVLQPGRSWKGRAGQRRIGVERFPAVVPCSPRW